MKKTICENIAYRLFFIVLTMVASAYTASASGNVKFATWMEKVHDFGIIAEADGKVACRMRLVNTTDSAMVITEVRPSCGCTAADYPHRPIAPGDTASIYLVYNPYGRPGEFSKDVVVRLNCAPRRTVLKIKGSVIAEAQTVNEKYPVSAGSLKISGSIAMMGEVAKGNSRNAYLDAYNTGRDSVRVYALDVPKCLSIKMMPDTVPPGGLCAIIVHLATEKCKEYDWGPTEYEFRLLAEPLRESASAYAGIARISAIANLKEDFSRLTERERAEAPKLGVATDKIDLGRIDGNAAKHTFEITNMGKQPLKVRCIMHDDGIDVTIDRQTLKHGKKTKISISVRIEDREQYVNKTLTLITNDPETPQKVIRIVGTK